MTQSIPPRVTLPNTVLNRHNHFMLASHQLTVNRFITACQSDPRIIAAALYGSNVKGAPDEHSDLDLAVITTDDAFDDFLAQSDAFVRLLGNPLFIENFGNPNFLLVIIADGTEIELMLGCATQPNLDTSIPYRVLLDKQNIFAGALPKPAPPPPAAQEKKLRDLITWFWHDLSHFITAVARGQLWWAYGQLDILRLMCVNLARLTHDFSDPEVGDDSYFKLDKILSDAELAPLQTTFPPMERGAMMSSANILLDFYRTTAVPLAQAHNIPYPAQLDNIMSERMKKLSAP